MGKMRKREKAKQRKMKNALRMRMKRQLQSDVFWILDSIISGAAIKAERERIRKDLALSASYVDRHKKMELLREKRLAYFQNASDVEEYTLPQLRSRSAKIKRMDTRVVHDAVLERRELRVDLSQEQILFHVRADLAINVPNAEQADTEMNPVDVCANAIAQNDQDVLDDISAVQVKILDFHEF